MKNYVLNKNTNEKIEVELKGDEKKYWASVENGEKIIDACYVSELPKGIVIGADCTYESDLIVERLRRTRIAKGISLRQLEVITGISNQNISKMEKSTCNPTIESVTRIASVLGYKLVLVPIDLSIE